MGELDSTKKDIVKFFKVTKKMTSVKVKLGGHGNEGDQQLCQRLSLEWIQRIMSAEDVATELAKTNWIDIAP